MTKNGEPLLGFVILFAANVVCSKQDAVMEDSTVEQLIVIHDLGIIQGC